LAISHYTLADTTLAINIIAIAIAIIDTYAIRYRLIFDRHYDIFIILGHYDCFSLLLTVMTLLAYYYYWPFTYYYYYYYYYFSMPLLTFRFDYAIHCHYY